MPETGVDLARFQALTKIKDSVNIFKSSKYISEETKIDVINKTAAFVHDIIEACQNSIPFEEALRLRVKTIRLLSPGEDGMPPDGAYFAKVREVLKEYHESVTPEQFLKDVRRAVAPRTPLYDDLVKAEQERKSKDEDWST